MKPGTKVGPSLTVRLRDILDQDFGAASKALIAAGVKAALGDGKKTPPDFRFWNAIFERMDGRVIERVALEDNGPLFRIVAGISPATVCGIEAKPKAKLIGEVKALLESDKPKATADVKS